MCGVQAFRRTFSLKDLSSCAADDLQGAGIKPSKSYCDIRGLLDAQELAAELKSLHIRTSSMQSISDDTGRSSPISGYEQLMRSRSPSAVLFAADAEPAPPAALAPQLLLQLNKAAEAAASQQAGALPPRASPPRASLQRSSPPRPVATAAGATQLQHTSDTPFLGCESASSFKEVEVQAVAATVRSSSGVLPPHAWPAAQLGPRSDSAPLNHAAAAAAQRAAEDPVRHAAAASQCAFAAAAAGGGSSLGSSPPSSAGSSALGSMASPSPFARAPLPVQQHPRLILPSPPLPASGTLGDGTLGSAASSPTSTQCHSRSSSCADLARRGSLDGWGTSSHLSEGHAAEELFYRLNHARQTVDFVKRQATAFSQLNKGTMGVWEALELLNTLREYETALLGDAGGAGADDGGPPLSPDMPLLEHALQSAEACRAAFPDEDCMHLAGLLAPLGKLLAHAKWGAEPQWAICGETFPVGCRFHPAVRHSQYFAANPDRRKRLYASPTGVYREGCGLGGVLMSWGAGEYLHLVLRLNRVALPAEALFCLRHQKLRCVFRPGAPYGDLLSEFDRVQLPRLAKFQQLCGYRATPRATPLLVPDPRHVGPEAEAPRVVAPELHAYYDSLLAKYVPQGVLRW